MWTRQDIPLPTPPIILTLPLPPGVVRRYMLGTLADEALVDEVVKTVASVPAPVLASRVQSVLSADEGEGFAGCTAPTLYLRSTGDRLVPDTAWRRMAATRRMSVVHVSGPHLVLQANPVGAWETVTPFLESLSAGGP